MKEEKNNTKPKRNIANTGPWERHWEKKWEREKNKNLGISKSANLPFSWLLLKSTRIRSGCLERGKEQWGCKVCSMEGSRLRGRWSLLSEVPAVGTSSDSRLTLCFCFNRRAPRSSLHCFLCVCVPPFVFPGRHCCMKSNYIFPSVSLSLTPKSLLITLV